MDDPSRHTPLVVVLTTVGAATDPTPIARALVDERLAACVQVLPEMVSVYRWQGAVQQEPERQLVIKTSEDRLAALEARLLALHPYEVPELVVLRGSASAAYGGWVTESVAPA
jgi:periplasmic divalent cation tolerance protein